MSEVPDVSISVTSGGRPIINSGLRRTHVAIGWTSAGTNLPREVNYDALLSQYVSGDVVKSAARVIDRVSANAIMVRRDYTPVSATSSSSSSIAGTAVLVLSGTPTEAWEISFDVTSGNTINSGLVGYTLTLDGGATETSGNVPTNGSVPLPGTGFSLLFNPPANSLVAITTEIRSDLLAHFANVVAHNVADAAAIAAITLAAPTDNTESIAVLNQCLAAVLLHLDNNVVHDSFDLANVPTVAAAVTEQDAVLLAINLKTFVNLHLLATFPADDDALLLATATVTSPSTVAPVDMIPAGLTQLANYPSRITFTTGGGTPSNAPDTADIVGFDENGDPQTVLGFAISQIAGTVTTTESWTSFTVNYVAGDGTDATVSIGLPDAAHNSADVTNTITGADPGSGTLVTTDNVSISSTDPSPAVLSFMKTGGGTLVPTASGTPTETFRGRIEFLTPGEIALATDTITYRLSLDGGATWQPVASLGVATSINVQDRRTDGTTADTGIVIALPSGQTVDVDTVITFRTTAPHVAIADVLAAIDAAVASGYSQRGWRALHVVGEYAASEMAQIQTKMDAIQADKQWTYVFVSFPDKRNYEAEDDWVTRVVADRALLNGNRVSPGAGYGRSFTCPVTGRLDRRPAAWMDVVRRLCVNENVESGRKIDGPIGSEVLGRVGGETASGDVTLYEDGVRVEYDAQVDSRLADARITVLRTFRGEGLGVFINGSRLGTGPASNFTRTRDRELNDLVSRALNSEGIRNLLLNVGRNEGDYPTGGSVQPGDPGTILESEALNLEQQMIEAILGVASSIASTIRVVLTRTDNLTGQLGAVAVPRNVTYKVFVTGQPVIEGVIGNQVFNG